MNKREEFDFNNKMGLILRLQILNEVMEFAKVNPQDTIVEIDSRKFYEHCYKKFFKHIADENYKNGNLDKEYTLYNLQIKWLDCMNHVSVYNVERIRIIELANEFNKAYLEYLNK